MQALSSPQQQGFERLDKDQQLRRPNQSKGPSPVVLLMLLSLIPVMFCAALGIRYVTRGPRIVHNAGTPKTTAVTPYEPPPGSEKHDGELPADVQPQHYDVTLVLKGTTLADPNLEVSGRVAAKLKAEAATSKIILKAAPETITGVKMALLTDDAPTPTSVKITSLSVSTSFLIATLENPLVAQKSYTLLTELARMQLTKDTAHKAFPCFEKTGVNVPIELTLQTPADLIAVSNAPPEAHSFLAGALNEHKFRATMPMPPDMLAWSVFPNTMTKFDAIPNLVFSKPADAQDSLGLIVLDDATAPEALCAKIATQWTHVLMRQPSTETWLAKAGVKYLCRLAETDKSNLPTVFMNDLKECIKPTPAAGTKDLLVFRMMHIIHGDAAFQTAIQKYVTATIFGSAADDKEHAIFAPLVPKEHVVAWLKEDFKAKKVVREFGTTKKITWKNADTTNTPFAKSAESGTITLPAPAPVVVEWLNATKADFVVTAEDNKPLYVNPSMMACYGVELDSKSWELIGKSIETAQPDAINGWYLLGEAAKQFKAV
ncbi:hypothetical protein HPB50_019967 [Hyalomma asiaticum]|uniref:Uncharacterized protein n=1 Tax=Hyalomma asiaticum TaxID=266040 RepID=A0ACB7SZY8_HYAAI|nr:hypothetical protein HPB50_019967 [Hyalomma asiaticum]